ncbi:hypothetical protein V2J09_007042 [Rumex salicifolius]
MDHGHGMMGGGAAAAPSPFPGGMRRRGMMMHMTFFWGKNTEVLFDGWPGRKGAAMYAACLAVVFFLAVLVEWLSNCRLIKPGTHHVAAGLTRTLMHTLRIGLAYLVMLAVMSFNGGVFLAAVAGHAVGFLIFGSRVSKKAEQKSNGNSDLPAMSC